MSVQRMSRALLTLALAATLGVFVLPTASGAADRGPLPLEIEDVDVGAHPTVRVTVSTPPALTGADVPGSAFSLTEAGAPRPLRVSQLPNDQLEVVLAIDTSGSMSGAPLAAAQDAAVGFVDALPPGVRLGVLGFGTTPTVASALSGDLEAHADAIRRLEASGETALYDSVVAALEQLGPAEEDVRRVLVLLSDGGDTVSETSLDDAREQLSAADVGLYAIGLESPEADRAALAELVAATDGELVPADEPDALQQVYDDIATTLISQYLLEFDSERNGATPAEVTLAHDGVTAVGAVQLRLPAASPTPTPSPTPDAGARLPAIVIDPGFLGGRAGLILGGAAIYVALALAILLLLAPRRKRATLRRDAAAATADRQTGRRLPAITQLTERATRLADRGLQRDGRGSRLNAALERAGIELRPGEFVVLCASVAFVAGGVGYVAGGAPLAGVLAVVVTILARGAVSVLTTRRRARFANQLTDTLQLLAGSLRAGYGLLQAVDSVARESDGPTAVEFRRVIVEARLGRDVNTSLQAMAERLDNDDFVWVVQAIEIHRQVGGDLAEVLDNVAGTIRERDQIRRQIKALSAEGRLSAAVLLALPIVVGLWIRVSNPEYMAEMTGSSGGRVMMAVGVGLVLAGAVWLKKIIRVVF